MAAVPPLSVADEPVSQFFVDNPAELWYAVPIVEQRGNHAKTMAMGNGHRRLEICGKAGRVHDKGIEREPITNRIELWEIALSQPEFRVELLGLKLSPDAVPGCFIAGLVVESPDVTIRIHPLLFCLILCVHSKNSLTRVHRAGCDNRCRTHFQGLAAGYICLNSVHYCLS